MANNIYLRRGAWYRATVPAHREDITLDELIGNIDADPPDMGLGYLVYTAKFGQAGVAAPSVIEFQNTIDDTASWVRDDVGFYSATTDIDFVDAQGKVWMPPFSDWETNTPMIPVSNGFDGAIAGYYFMQYASNDSDKLYFLLVTIDESFAPIEFSDLFGDTSISLPEIRIYQ